MSANAVTAAKFPLGRTVATSNALSKLTPDDILHALARHQSGDWGDMSEDDQNENNLSLEKGFRLFSVYHAKTGVKFWIITEADRSVTTILMPEDY